MDPSMNPIENVHGNENDVYTFFDSINQMASLLNTGLNEEQLSIIIELLNYGVNAEQLARLIIQLRNKAQHDHQMINFMFDNLN
ncbi:uncharacterized protein LOC142597817 [Dermatophagoides farinae]|uniref:Uncharacterized protein n=1 Tax=Dermatophagoides farinae TaxID=6954 RepID=A0A922HTL1_DERFA|nr:hypothetical protein HUG17_10024 [Dermatophagoides farinae]KAH9506986.1 hypothetical protein DERF_011691 [Dermatophagoides farinae]